MTQADRDAIRDYYQHGIGNRIVRIQRDGRIMAYGSPDDTCRDWDRWYYVGDVAETLQAARGERIFREADQCWLFADERASGPGSVRVLLTRTARRGGQGAR